MAQAQNGALTSHQVIDGGHDGSFDSAAKREVLKVYERKKKKKLHTK